MRNKNSDKYLGMSKLMKNGQMATIINYKTANNIDVEFADGSIVYHKSIRSFLDGAIKKSNLRNNNPHILNRVLGMTVKQKNGLNATVIKYEFTDSIDVEFEDGYIVHNTTLNSFKNGRLYNPNVALPPVIYSKAISSVLNTTRIMSNGEKATCIAYHAWDDIDIQFEDGTIVKHKMKFNFINGRISKSNSKAKKKSSLSPRHTAEQNKAKYLNITKTMKNGLKATIIEFYNNKNLTVKFENGYIRTNVSLTSFNKGSVSNTYRAKSIKVYCITNGKTYNTLTEASKDLKIGRNSISRVINGKQSDIKGYSFKALKD